MYTSTSVSSSSSNLHHHHQQNVYLLRLSHKGSHSLSLSLVCHQGKWMKMLALPPPLFFSLYIYSLPMSRLRNCMKTYLNLTPTTTTAIPCFYNTYILYGFQQHSKSSKLNMPEILYVYSCHSVFFLSLSLSSSLHSNLFDVSTHLFNLYLTPSSFPTFVVVVIPYHLYYWSHFNP